MAAIVETAERFFEACETGQGWGECQQYCHPDATFSAQAAALEGVDSLQAYTEWMKGLLTPLPDGRAEVRSFAVDEARSKVSAYGVFHGTHTGEGGRSADRKERGGRLRLRHGLRGRQDPPHDEDLERRGHDAAARVEVAPPSMQPRGDESRRVAFPNVRVSPAGSWMRGPRRRSSRQARRGIWSTASAPGHARGVAVAGGPLARLRAVDRGHRDAAPRMGRPGPAAATRSAG